MGKIFCLMGKSSTGKDTIYHKILERDELQLERIVPYTTRPIRQGETEGKEYCFISDKDVNRLKQEGRIIEQRAYNTVHGIWRYMTVDDGSIDLKRKNYFVIGTPESYEKYVAHFTKDACVPILITVDDGIRLQRALDRERAQDEPKYKELCRRYLADEEDFSEEKLDWLGIGKRFENNELDTCVEEIVSYIKESQS